jgi:hypothetical protein
MIRGFTYHCRHTRHTPDILRILDLGRFLHPGYSICPALALLAPHIVWDGNSHADVGVRLHSIGLFAILALGLPRDFLF